MLYAWLPTMLKWISREPLETMLSYAARYCVEQAAAECHTQARYLEENQADDHKMWLAPIERVDLWRRRREVMFEAIEKLKEIK